MEGFVPKSAKFAPKIPCGRLLARQTISEGRKSGQLSVPNCLNLIVVNGERFTYGELGHLSTRFAFGVDSRQKNLQEGLRRKD